MVSAAFSARPFNLRDNVWLISQDVATNRSLVGWELWIDKVSYSPSFSGEAAYRYMSLNGSYVLYTEPNGFDFRYGDNFLLNSGTAYINHNSDGTGSVAIAASANFDVLGTASLSVTIGLPTIARASTCSIANPQTRDVNSAITINTNRASSGFTHTLSYSFAGATGTIATGVGASYAWTPPLSLLNQIPDAASALVTITCKTYSGATLIGTKNSQFTLAAGSGIIPTIASLTVVDNNPTVSSIVGAFVQNLSILDATVNASGVYSSTIAASAFSMSGTTAPSGGEIPVTDSGSVALAAAATDSRGRVASWSGSLTVLPYQPPLVTSVQVRRATSGGVVDLENGTYLRVDLNASVQSLINSTQRNSLTVKVYTRARGVVPWTARNVIVHGSLTYNTNVLVSGGGIFPVDETFEVRVEVVDKFNTAAAQIDVATAAVFMHWSLDGVGVGKYHEQGTLDVAGDGYFSGTVFSDNLDLSGDADVAGTLDVVGHVTAPSLTLSGTLMVAGVAFTRTRGTTAERNALYPAPTTDPARVALANQNVTWFNTDFGWEESYYAVTGLSGLTARGLRSGVASGWYPVLRGPKVVLNPGAAVSLGAGSNISGWSSTEWHRGDPADLVYSGGIVTVAKPGRYRVRWRTTIQQGSGAMDMWLYAGSTFANDAWPLDGTFYKTVGFEFSDVPLSAGDTTRAKANNGGPINFHISSSTHRGEYVVEYIGPDLVTS